MTFLNPLYLIALAAAAIPIILHLLNLRKTRVIEFSTLSFLKELQRSKIRKLKVKQWLLLALRTLLIIFIVLAFTRPALRSSLGFLPGTEAKSSVVLILDDSFSMLASDDGGQVFKQAKVRAQAILDLLKPGDEAALIKLSEAKREGRQFTAAIAAIRDEIESAQPSFVHIGLHEGLISASVLMQESKNINREVYILTDNQATLYHQETEPGGRIFDSGVSVYLLPLGARSVDNTAVTDIAIHNALFQKDKPADITATVLNDGSTPLQNGIVSVFLNGERISQKTVDVGAGATKTVDFSVPMKYSGFVEGFVELEDDAIPEDNRRYFAIHVLEQVSIVLGPSGGQEAAIMRLALQPSVAGDSPGIFNIDVIDRASLLSANFSRYDVVVLLGANYMNNSMMQRLSAYVNAGGGVFLFPDADGNTDIFSQQLLPLLSVPAPNGMTGSPGATSSYTTFGAIDYEHPLFSTIFRKDVGTGKQVVESPRLYASMRLRATDDARQVVTTSGGDAFLLDARHGKGRLLVMSTAPSLRWSDLPIKGLFVPLLHRSMFYLAAREDQVQSHLAGRDFDVALSSGASLGLYDLASPDGNATRLSPKALPSGLYFSLSGLDQPGIYTLKSGETVMRKIPINTDENESRMERAGDSQRNTFFEQFGVGTLRLLSRNDNIQQAVVQARYGVELWKYMLALALLCAVLEMLIARDVRKKQVQPSS